MCSGSEVLFLKIFVRDFFHLFADPLNTDESELARFVESQMGNPLLVDKEGHVFNTIRRNVDGTNIFWTCRESRRNKANPCPAKAKTKGIYVVRWTKEHNHEVVEHQLRNYDRKYTLAAIKKKERKLLRKKFETT